MLSALVLSNFVDVPSYEHKYFHFKELIMFLISLIVVAVTCEGLLLGCGISAIHMQLIFMLGRCFDPFSYPFFRFMFSPFLLLSPPTSHSYSQFNCCYFLHIARKIIGLKRKSKWEMENMQ
jgi:hypothetical protein